MHYAVQPRPLTQGALRAMQRSLLVLAVVLAHADAVQAMLPPTNRDRRTRKLQQMCSPDDKNDNGFSEAVSTSWFHGPLSVQASS